MTTNVDILFKELPTVSRADERISRPDTSPIGSDYDRERSLVSRNNDGKSFNDHLEDHDVSNKTPIRDDQKINDQSPSAKENDRANDRANDSVNENSAHNNKEQENSISEETVINVNNKPESKALNYTTKDLLLTETTAEKTALQNNVNTAQNNIKPNTSTIVEQSTVIGSSSKDTFGQSTDQNSEQKMSSQYGTQTIPTKTDDDAPKQTTLLNVTTDNQSTEILSGKLQSMPSESSNQIMSSKSASVTHDTLIKEPEQVLPREFNVENKIANGSNANLAPTTAIPGAVNVGEETAKISGGIIEQKPSTPIKQQEIMPIAENKIVEEINAPISAMASIANKEISNADLLQKPIPKTDTTAVESARVLPFAVVQGSNSVQKSSASSKKSGSAVTAATGTANKSTPSSAAQNTAQNTLSQTLLQNAQKSDIQIDLGLNGQKLDAPIGQTVASSSQSSIPANNLLAAQDVSFQKTLSAAAITKSDTPMNAKLINDQITVAINKNVVKGLNNFSIRLHPAELGQVDIKLEFAADGKMHAAMMVESEKTLSMLQRDQASLEKALQEAGIILSNKDMNFSLMKQNQENNANKFAGTTGSSKNDSEVDELAEMGSMQEIRMAYSNQTLDISV